MAGVVFNSLDVWLIADSPSVFRTIDGRLRTTVRYTARIDDYAPTEGCQEISRTEACHGGDEGPLRPRDVRLCDTHAISAERTDDRAPDQTGRLHGA
ncbi:hypothetical protein GCM10029978_051110 [Actinoallomurus acanthiterrae]